MSEIQSERVMSGDTPLTIPRPTGKPRAGIVLAQEAWGVTPHIEWLAEIFAGGGYLTAAPHLYHRTGDQVITDADFNKARSPMGERQMFPTQTTRTEPIIARQPGVRESTARTLLTVGSKLEIRRFQRYSGAVVT